ncbi:hypothetical protein PV378_13790 [Streptomyces scabiei]|uniref:hypothetical protein n=1 Tax=Streptomyces TaxID=1883 RepID=UPI0029AC9DC1|nr:MULTISPECIES: hypothetical protein [Streptomyces]MDX2948885.1 hypothetical protein [Streptomyces caniscabiei]MDX3047566.1 hypothetical protein [Streptomyces scabiei]
MGPVETAVRSDVDQLGDLAGVEPSLSELAYSLARRIDAAATGQCETCGEDVVVEDKLLPQLTRELRQTLAQLLEGRAPDDDDDLGDLASPD